MPSKLTVAETTTNGALSCAVSPADGLVVSLPDKDDTLKPASFRLTMREADACTDIIVDAATLRAFGEAIVKWANQEMGETNVC